MHTAVLQQVTKEFTATYGAAPRFVIRAPGRVNLIGEHTDYNDGFVLPMAIDRATWLALRLRDDHKVSIRSLDYEETITFDLASLHKDKMTWAEYPKGVAWALQSEGFPLTGWEGVSKCDVPMGAGLSSSASFELAVARAFSAASDFPWEAKRMAVTCQRAENEWVGMKCGIMDQMIAATGEEGCAVLIDCRNLSTRLVPLPAGAVVIVMDTATRRDLVDSAYNDRRAQCEAAASFFGVPALRDVSLSTFISKRASDPTAPRWRRARHVISEIERTVQAAAAMLAGDARLLGRLMDASHDSLRDDFQVTNQQLDMIVEIARKTPGCIGARMTGAGFGGCAVALVKVEDAQAFIRTVSADYQIQSGLTPNIFLCHASNGAELLQVPAAPASYR